MNLVSPACHARARPAAGHGPGTLVGPLNSRKESVRDDRARGPGRRAAARPGRQPAQRHLAAEDLRGGRSVGLDQRWLRDVNGFARHTPWLHAAMSGYASVVAFAALLLAGWQIARRSGQPGQLAGAMRAPAAALAALAASQPIAAHVAEARPYASMSGLLVLAHRSTEFSFPSDHATMAGAAAAGLFLINRRLGLIAAAFCGSGRRSWPGRTACAGGVLRSSTPLAGSCGRPAGAAPSKQHILAGDHRHQLPPYPGTRTRQLTSTSCSNLDRAPAARGERLRRRVPPSSGTPAGTAAGAAGTAGQARTATLPAT